MTTPPAWQAFHSIVRRSIPTTWRCRRPIQTRPFVEAAPARRPRLRPRPIAYYTAAATLTLGAGVVTLSDDARHAYEASRRAARVGLALVVCINDYRITLKTKDAHDPLVYAQLLKDCHKRCADRTLRVCEQNGSVFIKLGQHLSSLNYLLPREWCDTFIPLQDRCPVSSFESVEHMIVHDTGQPMSHMFDSFDTHPIAAASLAQVHLATLAGSGERVAVKVQHPALAEWVRMDLSLTRFTFQTLKRFFPEYDLIWLSQEMELSLPKELDFELEASNATEVRQYFANLHDPPPLLVPQVKWANQRVLVMEYLPGHRLDDFAYIKHHKLDRDEIAAAIARIMNEMIFGRGAPLHCDTHMGNIAIRATGKKHSPVDIILYDHGLYRHPPPEIRLAYAKLWLAILDADESRMRQHAHELAGITDEQFPLFASAITGRDYSAIKSSAVTRRRTESESEAIADALGDGLVEQLIQILARVPRVILLILKTNDLTRSLSESLQTKQGPVRQFLILARYAARAVYEEHMDKLGTWWASPLGVLSFVKARFVFDKVRLKLTAYEFYLSLRALLGWRVDM